MAAQSRAHIGCRAFAAVDAVLIDLLPARRGAVGLALDQTGALDPCWLALRDKCDRENDRQRLERVEAG